MRKFAVFFIFLVSAALRNPTASVVQLLADIKRTDNSTSPQCGSAQSKLSGLDQLFEDKRQIIFQNDSANKLAAKAVVNTKRQLALSKLGISVHDQEKSLIRIHEQYTLRSEDLLLVFIANVQEDPGNCSNYIKDFEAFYFNKRPRLSNQVIRLILFGP
jgi:hypothetical protein